MTRWGVVRPHTTPHNLTHTHTPIPLYNAHHIPPLLTPSYTLVHTTQGAQGMQIVDIPDAQALQMGLLRK